MSLVHMMHRTTYLGGGTMTNNTRYRTHPVRSSETFQICQLSKRHLATIAVALALITLLLVIFAYHGGGGVGSWFYSLLVVLSGLAVVVFGPLILCRFLVYAYYRQMELHRGSHGVQTNGSAVLQNGDLRVESQTQTSDLEAWHSVQTPQSQLYAAYIILTPEARSGLTELPSYEQAMLQNDQIKEHAMLQNGVHVNDSLLGSESSTSAQPSTGVVEAPTGASTSHPRGRVVDVKDDTPPPSYTEACALYSLPNNH